MSDHDHERDALLAAWQELGGALRAFFARRVPAADVDDLLQECWLKVSQGLPGLKEQERLGAWVFRIARNLIVDHRRREPPSPTPQGELAAAADRASGDDPPDLGARVSTWLEGMIDRLPAKYSEVLRDAELKQLPHREIARRLGLSVSGVKSRVQRGRALLRDKLLACCALEFDRRGAIRDYQRHAPKSCDC